MNNFIKPLFSCVALTLAGCVTIPPPDKPPLPPMAIDRESLIADATPRSLVDNAIIEPPSGKSVVLNWDASPDDSVTGYRAYLGGESGIYTNMVDVGNNLQTTIGGLTIGNTYFFVATAYNSVAESIPSNEVSYEVVSTPKQVRLYFQFSDNAIQWVEQPGSILSEPMGDTNKFYRLRIEEVQP